MGKFEEIYNSKQYEEHIYANSASTNSGQQSVLSRKEQVEKLCQIALDTRKFEIELYWKRTTYYWAFIAADITAYILVYTRIDNDLQKYLIMGVLALCGIVFSAGWFLSNKGSKYWQENWEDHISMLVTKHIGPIFTYHRCPQEGFLEGAPYSVSRTNQIISAFITLIWILSLFFPIWAYEPLPDQSSYWICRGIFSVVIIAIIAGILSIFYHFAKTRHYSNYCDWKKGQEERDTPTPKSKTKKGKAPLFFREL